MGLRDDILGSQDLRTVTVPVPEWGHAVTVRSMSAKDRSEWEAWCDQGKDDAGKRDGLDVMVKAVIVTLVDESGQRVFERSDLDALKQKSAAALIRLFGEVSRLNGLSENDLEELRKN